ncbi:hypothetical protein AHiyo8_44120 [Arthrobacter sp. Hiyo8]|nr:hypothetical protein AHiyo8_44120 [Arthrobacter sp. Hiyo8]
MGLRADHNQVNRKLCRKRCDGAGVVPVDRVRGDQLGDAGVSRSRVDLGNVGILEQGADNCVFAAAGANDEYLHSLQGYFVRGQDS